MAASGFVRHVGLPQGVKETDFFVWQYSKGLEWYAAHFQNCPLHRPIGEFSPNYFGGTQTRERIARDIPGCKIICTLRDPVERAYSHYRKMREGEYFSGSFEECLEQRRNVLNGPRYAYHIRVWRRLFGAEKVRVLIQDDLKSNPQDYLNQVCDFIEIPQNRLANSASQRRMVNAIPNLPRNARISRTARILRDRLQKRGYYKLGNPRRIIYLFNLLFGGVLLCATPH